MSEAASENALVRAAAPVQKEPTPPPDEKVELDEPEPGIALCLSGGGYRAMLFHLGALWRLNELGYLPRLERVSSVSGGSITAGVLAHAWKRLTFDEQGVATNFEAEIVAPLRRLAERTIDVWAITRGLLLPGSIGERLAASYRRHLFGRATLQELPKRPRFVFNATNLQSGVLWRFSRLYLWDWQVGEVARPTLELALAVAASSAFPPFLSPVVLHFKESDFVPGSGDERLGLQRPPYTTRVVLSDGGVYDNLGLETAWKNFRTILISDGGGKMGPQERPRRLWPVQMYRVLSVIDNQVRSLRKRQAIDGYKAKLRAGTYWGIRSHVKDYRLSNALLCPEEETDELARTRTRLASMPAMTQERLINWGYAICDTAMRRHVEPEAPEPQGFRYADVGVGPSSFTQARRR